MDQVGFAPSAAEFRLRLRHGRFPPRRSSIVVVSISFGTKDLGADDGRTAWGERWLARARTPLRFVE